MAHPMARRVCGLIAAAGLGLAACALPAAADVKAWRSGAAAFKTAQRMQGANKGILLYFYADWCPYCRALEKDVLNSRVFEQYARSIVTVRIEAEQGSEQRALAEEYRVTGYPTLLAFVPGAQQPKRLRASKMVDGESVSMTPEEFVAACQEVLGGGTPSRSTRAPGASAEAAPASAGRPVTLQFTNGSTIQGTLISADDRLVTIKGAAGKVAYRRSDVRAIMEQ